MSQLDPTEASRLRRPPNPFAIVLAGAILCAGLLGIRTPASADTFSHLPSIDLVPIETFATGNDEFGSPGGPDICNNITLPVASCLTSSASVIPNAGNSSGQNAGGLLDLNLLVTVPLVKGVNFQYEHDRGGGIDTTIGRVTNAQGKYIYVPTQNDIVDNFRLTYNGIRYVGIQAGTFYRFRHDNQATNDPSPLNLQPQDWHEQYLQINVTSPPILALNGMTFGVYADGEYNKHHVSGNPNVSPLALANAGSGLAYANSIGYSDTDGKARYGVNYGFNANLPINHRANLFGSWSKGAFDFFDNNPVPFYYTIVDVGISKSFNKLLSLTADLNNLTQYNLGNDPFVPPNTIHRIYFAIAADFHLAK